MAKSLSETKTALEKVTSPKQKRFLNVYRNNGGIITRAAKTANIDRRYHYRWMENDTVYAEAFEEANKEVMETINEEIFRRAVEGIEKPVFYKGERVDTVREYSDNLLMFLAKRKDPQYRDNFQQNIGIMSGAGGKVNIQFNIPRPPVEDGK